MANFQTGLSSPSSAFSVQTPVQDDSMATAVSAAGGLFTGLAEGKAAAEQQEINAVAQKELASYQTKLMQLQTAVEMGKMSQGQARVRSRQLTAGIINQAPALRKDVSDIYTATVGGSGLAVGLNKLSPEEEAIQEARKQRTLAIQNTAKTYGVSEDAAADIIEKNARTAQRKSELELIQSERQLKGDELNQLTFLRANEHESRISQEVGALSVMHPDGIPEGETQNLRTLVKQSALDLRESLRQDIVNNKGVLRQSDLNTINDTVAKYEQQMMEWVDSKSEHKIATNIASITGAKYNTFTYKHLSGMKFMKEALGEQQYGTFVQTMIDAGRDNKMLPVLMQDPVFKAVFNTMEDLGQNKDDLFMGFMEKITSNKGGDQAVTLRERLAASTVLFLNGSPTWYSNVEGKLPEKVGELMKIYSEQPAAVAHWMQPQWEGAVRSGKVGMETVQKSLESAAFGVILDFQRKNGRLNITQDDVMVRRDPGQYSEFSPAGEAARGKKAGDVYVFSPSMDAYQQGRMRDIIKVANKYPALWQDKYDSPEHYMLSLVGFKQEVSNEPK